MKSLAAERELAEMFTPSAASENDAAAKNLAGLLLQWEMRAMGSHSITP